jgi:hypothetical protein
VGELLLNEAKDGALISIGHLWRRATRPGVKRRVEEVSYAVREDMQYARRVVSRFVM